MELNRYCTGELIAKHSTSAVDTSNCFFHVSMNVADKYDEELSACVVTRYNLVSQTEFFHFIQMKQFWKHLAWPDVIGSFNFVLKLLEVSIDEISWSQTTRIAF